MIGKTCLLAGFGTEPPSIKVVVWVFNPVVESEPYLRFRPQRWLRSDGGGISRPPVYLRGRVMMQSNVADKCHGCHSFLRLAH